jgi:hypothetical protein
VFVSFDEESDDKPSNLFSISHGGVVFEENGIIKYLDFKSKGCITLFRKEPYALFKNGQEVFIQFYDHSMIIYDLKSKLNVFEEKGECSLVISEVKFDSNYIIYSSDSRLNSFVIYNRKTKEKNTLYGRRYVEEFHFSGNTLLMLCNGAIYEYELNTRKHIGSYHDFQVREDSTFNFVFDDSYLVSSSECHIFIWSRRTKRVKSRIKFTNPISSMDLKCSYLAVGTHDSGVINIIDCTTSQKIYSFKSYQTTIWGLKFHFGDSKASLVTISSDQKCQKNVFEILDDQRFKRCSKCEKLLIEMTPKYCGRCVKKVYCSTKCQHEDWKEHQKFCKKK